MKTHNQLLLGLAVSLFVWAVFSHHNPSLQSPPAVAPLASPSPIQSHRIGFIKKAPLPSASPSPSRVLLPSQYKLLPPKPGGAIRLESSDGVFYGVFYNIARVNCTSIAGSFGATGSAGGKKPACFRFPGGQTVVASPELERRLAVNYGPSKSHSPDGIAGKSPGVYKRPGQ